MRLIYFNIRIIILNIRNIIIHYLTEIKLKDCQKGKHKYNQFKKDIILINQQGRVKYVSVYLCKYCKRVLEGDDLDKWLKQRI